MCQAWQRSRSALYARQTREQQRHKGEEPARRGPTPTVSDATLLEAIQADLDRSPFQGEGHEGPRAAGIDGIRVARTRVLRAHKLLSPHRGRQGRRVHAGTIVTQAPNVMWGIAGVRVFTLDEWGSEWHVCKVGSRFAALEPKGLRRIYGALDADSARGLALRMDHGSQYLSDHFLPVLGPRERRGGAVESHAQGASDPQKLRVAFVERYNTTWRLEKMSYAGRRRLTWHSDEVGDVLRDWKGVDKPIIYLPHSYDPGIFKEVADSARSSLRHSFGLRDDQLIVGYFGRLAEEKGLHDYFDAIRLLDKQKDLKNIFFWFMGNVTCPLRSFQLLRERAAHI